MNDFVNGRSSGCTNLIPISFRTSATQRGTKAQNQQQSEINQISDDDGFFIP